jgi:hypothetical protein
MGRLVTRFPIRIRDEASWVLFDVACANADETLEEINDWMKTRPTYYAITKILNQPYNRPDIIQIAITNPNTSFEFKFKFG